MSSAKSSREAKPLIPEHLDRLAGRAYTRKRFEEVGDCLSDLRIGIEHDVASLIVDQAGREGAAILTASYLI